MILKKNRRIKMKYNIGLDIGTNSVGWAVTSTDGKLLRLKKKNAYGSRLFDAAETAKSRRQLRGGRRRIRRRNYRLGLLQQLFEPMILPTDQSFFIRLKNSDLLVEDKKSIDEQYILFNDKNYTDKKYYQEYPTIYHLRKEIIDNPKQKFDLRLVYLACHHIIKHRGHFLFDKNFDFEHLSIQEELYKLNELLNEEYNIELSKDTQEKIEEIILNPSTGKKDKNEELEALLGKKSKVYQILRASLGYSVKLSLIFANVSLEIKDQKIEINKENFDELLQEWESYLSDSELEIISIISSISSIYLLSNVISLDTEKSSAILSSKMVEKYDLHKSQLKDLKQYIKQHVPEQYNALFRDENCWYQSYLENCKPQNMQKCEQDLKNHLYPYLSEKKVEQISSWFENDQFLPKQKYYLNASIPYQVHKYELEQILNQQSVFYPELEKQKEKIIQLLEFKIPYYVGPLVNSYEKSPFSWLVKKKDEAITPWNFNQVVDKEKTAEQFIKRMTNQDTYLLSEDVLPKYSIFYQFFEVLNELNNIKVEDSSQKKKSLEPRIKQKIILDVFTKYKKVSISAVKKYLVNHGYYQPDVKISGVADKDHFLSSLSTIVDMKKIFGEDFISQYLSNASKLKQVEMIIEWITIFEDRSILTERLKSLSLSEQQVKQLSSLRYKGWGRLSSCLLCELKNTDGYGKKHSIMDYLWNTTANFMQIYHNQGYTFEEQVDERNGGLKEDDEYILRQTFRNPAIYKSINQSLKIIEELVDIIGEEPENIFIEFTREAQSSNTTVKRIDQLKKKYKDAEKDNDFGFLIKELKKELSDKDVNLNKEKVYLYFLQCGKCLYTGQTLDIHQLSNYQVDHIWPQSYTTDNSIDNKALVIQKENQKKSSDALLSHDIIKKQKRFWEFLNEMGLMSDIKLRRLTQWNISEDQQIRFLNRQIVQTSQSSKLLAQVLKNKYNNTHILTLNANLLSQFRNQFGLYKIRELNNYHHAHDAYLLTILGQLLQSICHDEDMEYGEYIYQLLGKKERQNRFKGFIYNLEFPIQLGMRTIEVSELKKVLEYKQCNISYKVEFNTTGGFYNQTIVPKENCQGKQDKQWLKNNKDPKKYGGYEGVQSAYCTLVKKLKGRKTTYERVNIPIYVVEQIKDEKDLNAYLNKQLNYPFEIICPRLGKNQKIKVDGIPYYLSSYKEYTTARELCIPLEKQSLLMEAKKDMKLQGYVSEDDKITKDLTELFDVLVECIQNEFAIKLSEKESNALNQVGKSKFLEMNNTNKYKTIYELMGFCKAKTNRRKAIDNLISSKRITGKTMISGDEIIFQSITGLLEKRVILK